MTRLSLPEDGNINTQDLLENIKSNKGVACFEMEVDWTDTDIEALNEKIDEVIESGYMLCDISYSPLRIENEELVLQVICADTQEWVEEMAN